MNNINKMSHEYPTQLFGINSLYPQEAAGFLYDKETIAHNPNHQVNLVRIESEHFLKVNHRRKLQDIIKDIRIMKAITNTPIPLSLPLTGLDYLKAIRAARKYI
uniref:Uncharacterized protein n=1 Tax=Caenorhabditis japonica TaxID=281687 RepID=A0A8R1IYL1_CAEJA